MTYPYLFFIIVSGFAITSYFHLKETFLNLSLSIMFGILLPSMIVYALNIFKTPIHFKSVIIPCIVLSLFFIITRLKYINAFFIKMIRFYKTQTKLLKFFYIIIFISFLGLIARGSVNEICQGDGMGHWAPKALEWIINQKLKYRPGVEYDFQRWVAYPLYHSIGMMINVLILPYPPANSIKIFDLLHFFGLFFSVAAFFRLINYSVNNSIASSLLVVFVQKTLLSYIIPGYADIDLAYYYFLSFVLLISITKSNHFKHDAEPILEKKYLLLSGIALGIMVITKDEGSIRVFILLFLYFLMTFKKNSFLNLNYVFLFLPIFVLKAIDFACYPASYFHHHYQSNLILNPLELIHRLPLIVNASLYALKPENLLKSTWVTILPFSLFILYLSKKENWKEKGYINFLFALFLLNFVFNHLPSWIADPSESVSDIGIQVLKRLHLQVESFICCICVIGIMKVFTQLKNKANF